MDQTARKQQLRDSLEQARTRTLRLFDRVPEALLTQRVHDFYSPVGWHFGHIGMTEEYWTVTQTLGKPCLDDALSFLFANIPDNPKDNRVHLPPREEIKEYLAETRRRALDALAEADLTSDAPLLADGYAWEFALQHECQHQESIAELLTLLHQHTGSEKPVEELPWESTHRTERVALPGGSFVMGSNDPHGYDNEKEEHVVEVAPFELDRTPVTAYEWSFFMIDGGYLRRELWSEAGWVWRTQENVQNPEYWYRPNRYSWFTAYAPNGLRALDPDEPVSCLSWFEADAYARWAGKRMPTEAEWEYAAAYDLIQRRSRRYPWGDEAPDVTRACFGLERTQPSPVGSKPDGASAFGLLDMAGNIWEWTSTPFRPYPGFRAYPYDGYSKDHMDGTHFVCRGGSWATAAPILRCSFRNWYVPTYRQGFLGLRCAR
jgi:iron(II)-dependent oxidoreductase